MKKLLIGLLTIAFLLCCNKEIDSISINSVSIDKKSIEIKVGDVEMLKVTINPSNASNKNVYWTSSDQSVATVDNTGKVTAVKVGDATITVTTEDGGKTATCKVTVNEKIYPVTGVTLDKTSVELTEGDVTVLTATVNPSNASNRNVYGTSSDLAVATVDANGKVTAIKAGKTTITVTTEDGGKTASCSVTVNAKTVSGVTLDKASVELTEGDKTMLTAIVTPSYATNKNVEWSSSNESVASVQDGVITAIKPGVATITVTTEDGGKTASCSVTVNERIYPVISVTLDKTSVELKKGETVILTAAVAPKNATNKNVIWSSSDSSTAKVENGVVTAVESGTATITVTTEDGNLKASCVVTVKRENDFNIGDWEDDGTDNGGTAE